MSFTLLETWSDDLSSTSSNFYRELATNITKWVSSVCIAKLVSSVCRPRKIFYFWDHFSDLIFCKITFVYTDVAKCYFMHKVETLLCLC